MIRCFVSFCMAAIASCSPALAQDSREILEVEIDAGIDDVWHAFTTTEGLKSWVTPIAEVDFRVGGKWRTNYNKDGELGDSNTIENTILSYDPKRMISLKATKFPEGFPFMEAAKGTWSVFYFAPVSKSRTRITAVGLGYTDSEQSQKMRSFFASANKYSFDQLSKALARKRSQQETPK